MMTTKQVRPHEGLRRLQFGAFRLDTHHRVIDRAGTPLRLGSRARRILSTLLEHAGEPVDKKELMARVWPRGVVEEGTLRVHISALRKALRESDSGGYYIENVTGRGYRFVAPVRSDIATEQVAGCPFPPQHLIGRAASISAATAWLPENRLVTIVGPGGVGKTAVALATADRLRDSYPDGVYLVDLAGVADPSSIGRSVAAALGIPTNSHDVLSVVIEYLKSKHTLLVLDSCERVVDGAAILVEELLGGTPNLNVIATCREPLRARDEWVLRLGPLEFPVAQAVPTAEQALRFPAIQLFVERATASQHNFKLRDTDVAELLEICRRLDGVPMAIELAAARIDLLGLHCLVAHLHERPGLLTRGYRAAATRHQSLRAMFDWAHESLTPIEQIVLRRLAAFVAPFDLASATALVIDDAVDANDVLDTIASLTAKSLLVTRAADERIFFRLFETSRAFALDKLECSSDIDEIRRRHASLDGKRPA